MTSARRQRTFSLLAAAAGLALFVYAIRRAGLQAILDGIGRVGWGLLPIMVLGGVRFAIRAECWRLCVPGQGALTFSHAFVAFLAGDAVGSVTPLGLLASEPTKVLLTRHHLATRESIASLTLENLIYSVSVLAVIAVGVGLLLTTAVVPLGVEEAAVGFILLLALAIAVVLVLLRRQASLTSRTAGLGWLAPLGAVAEEVSAFSRQQPGRLWRVFALDLAYHAVAVLEVYLTLGWLMGDARPTLVTALIFETLNRVVTIAFKFVPFRVGVDEALNGALAPLLTVDPVSGVALAVVRKVRSLFWAGVGLIAIAMHPARGGASAPDRSVI